MQTKLWFWKFACKCSFTTKNNLLLKILVLKYSFAYKTHTFPIISGVRMTVGSPDDSEGIHFSQAPKHTVDQPVTHAALVRRNHELRAENHIYRLQTVNL